METLGTLRAANMEDSSVSQVTSCSSRVEGCPMGDMGRTRFLSGHRLCGPVSFSLFTRDRAISSSANAANIIALHDT